MISDSLIQKAVDQLVKAASPQQIILFGSHARGEADEGSDVDFLVVEQKVDDPGAEMMRLHKRRWPLTKGVCYMPLDEARVLTRLAERDWAIQIAPSN